jgi:hypothetical protein
MVLAGNKTHCKHCSVFSTATRFKARVNSKITRGKNGQLLMLWMASIAAGLLLEVREVAVLNTMRNHVQMLMRRGTNRCPFQHDVDVPACVCLNDLF